MAVYVNFFGSESLQLMDRHAVGLVDRERPALHQEIVLFVVHLENTNLIILMV